MNSANCEMDVIPKTARKLQWRIMPLNGFVGPYAGNVTVNEIIYTAKKQKSQVGTESPKLPPDHLRLNPCKFLKSRKTKAKAPKKDGWVVYGYSRLKERDPRDCVPFDEPPSEGKCNCVPPEGKAWWYGVDWSGKFDNGLWDPRMRPEIIDDPTVDPSGNP